RFLRSESLRPESRFGLLDSRMLRFSCPGRNESATDRSWKTEIAGDNPCRLNRSMQHSSNLLIRLCFSKRPDPLGCTQLNLNRVVFSLNERSRRNLAVETSADWTSGRCCVDPLRPPTIYLSLR